MEYQLPGCVDRGRAVTVALRLLDIPVVGTFNSESVFAGERRGVRPRIENRSIRRDPRQPFAIADRASQNGRITPGKLQLKL
jgi:hypothetical protein